MRASACTRFGSEIDECCEGGSIDSVLERELGSDIRSASVMGRGGDLDGRDKSDICDGDGEVGNDERDGRRIGLTVDDPLAWLAVPLARNMYGKAVAIVNERFAGAVAPFGGGLCIDFRLRVELHSSA